VALTLQSLAGLLHPPGSPMSGVRMKDLKLGVLTVFAEAQAIARDITDEKSGNLRADYLRKKSAFNAEAWANIKANKTRRSDRNSKRRSNYDPAKRAKSQVKEWASLKADPKRLSDRNAKRRAWYARSKGL
jgi:hypothetical protein